MTIDPRYLEPPDLFDEERTCPDCDVVLQDGTCARCGVHWDQDAIREAAEAAAEPDEDWGSER
jgi:hypothetical protein